MRKGPLALLFLFAVAAAFVAGTWVAHRGASKGGASGGRKILHYVDPMHPAYKSDRPGIAPDCGMQLEPVYADGSMGGGASSGNPGTVTITPEKRQAVGVVVAKADVAPWTGTLKLLGTVAADEARTYRVNAASELWLRKVFPPTTGSFVAKDEPLAAYFTSGYLAAANSFLFAVETSRRHARSADVSQAQARNLDYQMRQAFGNLINIGVSESQIREMERTGKVAELAEIRSPADGFVLARQATEGQYAAVGAELYRIADLGTVWILAETYEREGKLLRPGMEVRAVHPQTNRVYRARVTEILPQFDAQTRTMKVRLEADNPGYLLRPDMFVDLEIPVRMPPVVTVPADAVIDTGTRKAVFVDRGEGRFEPRPVETGWRMGGRVEIVSGLAPGEGIVVSGNFLVDSESRMQLAAAGIYGAWHVDPVCAMQVDEGKARAAGRAAEHAGKTYYFCSDGCVADFRKKPAKYVKGAGAAAMTGTTARKREAEPARTANEGHENGGPRTEAKPAAMVRGGHDRAVAQAAAAPKMDPAAMGDDLPVDPICGMAVDPARAAGAGHVTEYRGRNYYFCADMCKRRFDADPATFLSGPGRGGTGAGMEDLRGSDALPVDPVCGMEVDPAAARAAGRTSERMGKTYFFCADMCKRRFDADPAAFPANPGRGGTEARQGGHEETGRDAHAGHGK